MPKSRRFQEESLFRFGKGLFLQHRAEDWACYFPPGRLISFILEEHKGICSLVKLTASVKHAIAYEVIQESPSTQPVVDILLQDDLQLDPLGGDFPIVHCLSITPKTQQAVILTEVNPKSEQQSSFYSTKRFRHFEKVMVKVMELSLLDKDNG